MIKRSRVNLRVCERSTRESGESDDPRRREVEDAKALAHLILSGSNVIGPQTQIIGFCRFSLRIILISSCMMMAGQS
jgi:hypothetical protein